MRKAPIRPTQLVHMPTSTRLYKKEIAEESFIWSANQRSNVATFIFQSQPKFSVDSKNSLDTDSLIRWTTLGHPSWVGRIYQKAAGELVLQNICYFFQKQFL